MDERVPRVLKPDDLRSYDGAVYIEYRDSGNAELALYMYERDVEPCLQFAGRNQVFALAREEWGITWRPWSRRPTAMDMVVVAWQG